VLNGHWAQKESQLSLLNIPVTQAAECVMAVTILPESDSGEHKVKLMMLTISDAPGEAKGLDVVYGLDYVHSIVANGKDGHFNLANHV
jgi:hypothetical protein